MSKEKIKFLATGDIHSDQDLVERIKNEAGNIEEYDFILIIGDISDENDDFKDILGIFDKSKVFMVPGNHETKKQLEILRNEYDIHLVGNSPVVIEEDLAIFGTNYMEIGPYGVPEEEVFENMIKNFKAVEDIPFKIHLTHIPPAGTEIGDASPFMPFISGSTPVRVFLENFNPNLTLTGHIHESSGLEEMVNKTKVLNVGRTFRIFEFDKRKGEVKLLN